MLTLTPVDSDYALTQFYKKWTENGFKKHSFYSDVYSDCTLEVQTRFPPPQENIRGDTSSLVHCLVYGCVVCVVLNGTGQQELRMARLC